MSASKAARSEKRGRQKRTIGFDLTIRALSGRQHISYLRKHLRGALGLIPSCLQELSLVLTGDLTMGRLHERFMGLAGPTDVLSFELETDERGRVTAGEVIVCVPEARRRAKERGISLERELLLYALHGMLHLSGYDDQTGREYRKMHEMEDRILEQLGVGAVFAPNKARRHEGTKARSENRKSDEATKRRGGAS